ncbi:hypothetical protein BDZ89DRAFT_684229 [Hymenopellis radicata]|nr:hypothetical protein BDZ89DRAFT_684229 [Hymenopellis radicata]
MWRARRSVGMDTVWVLDRLGQRRCRSREPKDRRVAVRARGCFHAETSLARCTPPRHVARHHIPPPPKRCANSHIDIRPQEEAPGWDFVSGRHRGFSAERVRQRSVRLSCKRACVFGFIQTQTRRAYADMCSDEDRGEWNARGAFEAYLREHAEPMQDWEEDDEEDELDAFGTPSLTWSSSPSSSPFKSISSSVVRPFPTTLFPHAASSPMLPTPRLSQVHVNDWSMSENEFDRTVSSRREMRRRKRRGGRQSY